MKRKRIYPFLDLIVDIGYKILYVLLCSIVFIMDLINGILDSKFGISLYHDRKLVEKYLLSTISTQRVVLLKQALKRFNLNYEDMFYLAEDLKVYDRLDMCLDYKGANGFSSEEKAVIEEARETLNKAPRDVTGQIIGFCFC